MYSEFLCFLILFCIRKTLLAILLHQTSLIIIFTIVPEMLYHIKYILNTYLFGLHTQFSYFPIVTQT